MVAIRGGRHLEHSAKLPNLVKAPLFDFLLELEEKRAVRLQYCFSVVWLLLEADAELSLGQLARPCAELITSQVRASDLVTVLSDDVIGALLIDADAGAVARIVDRMIGACMAWLGDHEEVARRVRWSAGASSYPLHGSVGAALLRRAESLMGQARAEGGNRLCLPVG